MKEKMIPRTLLGLLNPITEPIISTVRDTASNLIWYEVDMAYIRWSLKPEVLGKYFKHYPKAINTCPDGEKIKFQMEKTQLHKRHVDVCMFRGVLIWLDSHSATSDKGQSDVRDMSLKVIHTKKNIEMLHKFIKRLVHESRLIETKNARNTYHIVKVRNMEEYIRINHRSFDDVFILKEQESLIRDSVLKFCNSREWYKSHHIPYHFGIMLHGFPGTGKSSVVQAIINMIPCDVYYVPIEYLKLAIADPYWIKYGSGDRMRIVIIEDVDTVAFSRNRHPDDVTITSPDYYDSELEYHRNAIQSIGTLLNFIDGFESPENVIYIMTTNHLDDLDPALIRPGRIDLSLEIGYVTDETFGYFMKYHFNETVPERIHVRDGITFAELQTLIMRGYTFEQMCDFVDGA